MKLCHDLLDVSDELDRDGDLELVILPDYDNPYDRSLYLSNDEAKKLLDHLQTLFGFSN